MPRRVDVDIAKSSHCCPGGVKKWPSGGGSTVRREEEVGNSECNARDLKLDIRYFVLTKRLGLT